MTATKTRAAVSVNFNQGDRVVLIDGAWPGYESFTGTVVGLTTGDFLKIAPFYAIQVDTPVRGHADSTGTPWAVVTVQGNLLRRLPD
jgi:hypothetical protein